MIVALFLFLVAVGLYVTMYTAVHQETVGVEVEVARTQAFAAADGLAQVGEDRLLDAIARYRPLADGGAEDPFLVLEDDEDWDGVLDGHWTIHRATVEDAFGEASALPSRRETDPVTGIIKLIDTYDIRSRVRTPRASVTVLRRVEVERMPLFQFLVFYSEDLEINPGPMMNLDGRIHSNADIYVSAGTGLDVNSAYFRMAGELHRHRKDSDSVADGAIRILNDGTGALVPLADAGDLAARGIDSDWGIDSSFAGWDVDGDGNYDGEGELPPFSMLAESLFGDTLRTGEHGVSEFAHPDLPTIQPFVENEGGGWALVGGEMVDVGAGNGTHAPSFFHGNAELVIIDGAVFDGDGNDITAFMPAGFLSATTLYDAREGGDVPVVTVDLGLLGDQDGDPSTFDPSPYYPSNGLVYAYSNVAASDDGLTAPNSFVFTNGAELNVPGIWNADAHDAAEAPPAGAYAFGDSEATGLTIVAPTSVYVQGDFNTVNKKPASIIADTVNLLSNAWDFTKGPGQLPGASETTFNLAFVTGNQVSGSGNYNGGFENLPRFHENWSGVDCNITGAFVNLWRSEAAPGTWLYGGDRYQAPKRNWAFDHDFDDALPPYTPMVVSTRVVGWEVRN